MLLSTHAAFLTITLSTFLVAVAGTKKINITVMVPGIQAFDDLVRYSTPLPSEEYQGISFSNSSDGSFYRPTETLPVLPVTTAESMPYGDESQQESGSSEDGFPAYDEDITCVNETSGEVDIACLLHMIEIYPWSYVFAKPALDLALENIRNTNGLLDGYELHLQYYDSSNNQGFASSR